MTAVIDRSLGWAACSDEVLIGATRAGDADAYAELYARTVGSCRRLARRLCGGSDAAADDVVSEVFAGTLRAIHNGHGPTDAFAPYVLRSVRHQAGRTRSRGDGRYADAVEPAALEPLAPTADVDPTDHQLVCDAFGRLPQRFRHVLWWVEVEGRPHDDIGARLGLRPPAVAALVHRARDAFCRAYLEVRTDRAADRPECAATRSKLASYVRGSLCEASRRKVDEHTAACSECEAIVEEMRRLDTSLRSVPWVGGGLVGASRWAAVLERSGAIGSELARLVATVAIGTTAIAGPPGVFETVAPRPVAPVSTTIHEPMVEPPVDAPVDPPTPAAAVDSTGGAAPAAPFAPSTPADRPVVPVPAVDAPPPAGVAVPVQPQAPLPAIVPAPAPLPIALPVDPLDPLVPNVAPIPLPVTPPDVDLGIVVGVGGEDGLLQLGVGAQGGLLHAAVGTDDGLVELGVADGLAEVTIAAPGTLLTASVADAVEVEVGEMLTLDVPPLGVAVETPLGRLLGR